MRDFTSVEYVIRLEDPRQDDVIRILSALDAYLESLYPPESNHLLDVGSLCAPNIRFFVARRGVDPVGCGALRVEAGYGEVKRMFVAPEARGPKRRARHPRVHRGPGGARRPRADAPRDRDSPGGGARAVPRRWLRRVRP